MGFSPREAEASKRKERQRAPFERRIIRSSLWLAIPGLVTSGILIWLQDWAIESKLALLAAEFIVCGLILAALHDQIIRPLQTLANVVGALRAWRFQTTLLASSRSKSTCWPTCWSMPNGPWSSRFET